MTDSVQGTAFALLNPPVDAARATGLRSMAEPLPPDEAKLPRFAVADLSDLRCPTDDPVEAEMFAVGRGGDSVIVALKKPTVAPARATGLRDATETPSRNSGPPVVDPYIPKRWKVTLYLVGGKVTTSREEAYAYAEFRADCHGRPIEIRKAKFKINAEDTKLYDNCIPASQGRKGGAA